MILASDSLISVWRGTNVVRAPTVTLEWDPPSVTDHDSPFSFAYSFNSLSSSRRLTMILVYPVRHQQVNL